MSGLGFLAPDDRRIVHFGRSKWFVPDLLTELAFEKYDTTLLLLGDFFMKLHINNKEVIIWWSFDSSGSLFEINFFPTYHQPRTEQKKVWSH